MIDGADRVAGNILGVAARIIEAGVVRERIGTAQRVALRDILEACVDDVIVDHRRAAGSERVAQVQAVRAQAADVAGVVHVLDRQLRIQQLQFGVRSEEHTSELQSLMRNSYAVFCLKKQTQQDRKNTGYT